MKKTATLPLIFSAFLLLVGAGCGLTNQAPDLNQPIEKPAGEKLTTAELINSYKTQLQTIAQPSSFEESEAQPATYFQNKDLIEKIIKLRMPNGEGSVHVTIFVLKDNADKQKLRKEIEDQWIELRKVDNKIRAEWLLDKEQILIALSYKIVDAPVAQKIKDAIR